MLLRLAPVFFVLIWSTGWITARAAAPLADPLTFLVARYALAPWRFSHHAGVQGETAR
jgi:drug/metabolite transporter (DMT)-like permease